MFQKEVILEMKLSLKKGKGMERGREGLTEGGKRGKEARKSRGRKGRRDQEGGGWGRGGERQRDSLREKQELPEYVMLFINSV